MEIVIGLVALLFALFVVLGVVVTVRTVRAVKRGVERTGTQVRNTVQETSLKARSMQPGPVGEMARVRLELRSSIDSTRRALEAAASDDPSLQEAVGLLDRLHDHARQLDRELRVLMEREPDRARVAERLPDARERMRAIKESADSLRFAAQDRARRTSPEDLASLREQIEIESGALRHWEPVDGVHGRSGEGAAGSGEPSGSRVPDGSDEQGGRGGGAARGEDVKQLPLPDDPKGPLPGFEKRRPGADRTREPHPSRRPRSTP